MRLFSTIQDQQSRELSQRHTARRAKRLKVSEEELKLPRVVGLDTCQACSTLLSGNDLDLLFHLILLQSLCAESHALKLWSCATSVTITGGLGRGQGLGSTYGHN